MAGEGQRRVISALNRNSMLNKSLNFSGKVALASAGIGLATAQELAEAGVSVALADFKESS
jgi:hypothetical protein